MHVTPDAATNLAARAVGDATLLIVADIGEVPLASARLLDRDGGQTVVFPVVPAGALPAPPTSLDERFVRRRWT